MLRRAAAVLALCLLLLPAATDAQRGGRDGPRDGPRDDRQEMRHAMMERWEGMNHTQRERGLMHAEARGMFARLAYDAGTGIASGGFLRFHVQADAGAIHDVRVRAARNATLVPLLAGVTPQPFALEDGPVVHGAMLSLEGANVDLTAHNDPSASLTWHARSHTNLTFALAPGLRPVATDGKEVRITIGATHAHIVTSAQGSVRLADNGTVVAALGPGDSAVVRVHPLQGGEALHDMLAAFRADRMGVALRVTDAGGVAAEDGEATDVRASTKEIRRGRVVWEVASDQRQGRVLFITMDNATLDMGRLADTTVTLNGTLLRRVGQSAEVVAATDGAFAIAPSQDGATATLVVHVPHFSSYALALTQPVAGSGATDAPADGSGTASRGAPGLTAGALLALGLALLLRRRA